MVVKQIKKRIVKVVGRVLEASMPASSANVAYNKALWNRYARSWNYMKRVMPLEDRDAPIADRASYLKHLGDEWGRSSDIEDIVAQYIYPFVCPESVVGEIGSGGGRIASRVAPKVRHFYCFDISSEMLKKARAALNGNTNASYVLLKKPVLPSELQGQLDFIYAFDVFVHLDLHTLWKYFQQIAAVLKRGGKAFVHTANLRAPDGWKRFMNQNEYSVLGHYFICPEIVEILAHRSGLKIIQTSPATLDDDETNHYFKRDFLAILEKSI
jgi:SAM-dependent methyltransferase